MLMRAVCRSHLGLFCFIFTCKLSRSPGACLASHPASRPLPPLRLRTPTLPAPKSSLRAARTLLTSEMSPAPVFCCFVQSPAGQHVELKAGHMSLRKGGRRKEEAPLIIMKYSLSSCGCLSLIISR